MNPSTARTETFASPTAATGLDALARRAVLTALSRIEDGRLVVVDGTSRHAFGADASEPGLAATLRVHDRRFWLDAALGGSLGAAESYVRGEWDADDPVALVRVMARNRAAIAGVDGWLSRLQRPLLLGLHALRRNTPAGSRRNIATHYDLGNAFFAQFLDETMLYSSAIYPDATASLELAQRHKLAEITRRLGVEPGHHVLEIGTGWGALAVHLARTIGCRVTTTTISQAQYDGAAERIRAAGVGHLVTLLKLDYRDLAAQTTGRFDRIVSIEMIEAVGHEYLDTFFATLGRLLAPDGRALLQAIVMRDQDFDAYRRSVDFIQKHIFPGGALPSVSRMASAVARVTPLRIAAIDDLTPHYARTLHDWRGRFERATEAIDALGYGERFRRLWRWYFCYCEGGFLERTVGLVHVTLAGPRHGVGPLPTSESPWTS